MASQTQDKELQQRIRTILVLRVIFLSGFLALVILFQQKFSVRTPLVPLSVVIGGAYFLSATYALLLRHAPEKLFLNSWLQVAGDFFVVSGILYVTGGIESPFSFLYSLVIIATGVMLPRTATYAVASAASIAYGLLLDFEYYNIIHPVYFFGKSPVSEESSYVFYILFVNIASYYSVAFLSSLLSSRLIQIKEQLASAMVDLMELQAFHKNVVQNMGSGLITTDLDGRITSMNPAGEEITGYAFAECAHLPCHRILELPELKTFFGEPRRANASRHYIEGRCRRKNGESMHIMLKLSSLMDPDTGSQARGFICVFEDLSEIKAMEEKMVQAEQLALVGRFSAGLAHEIRNPLASLSGSIQVLSKGLSLEEKNRRLMEIVLQETERLNRIIGDFLNFALPRKKQNTLTDLTQLVQDVVTLLKNSDEPHPQTRIVFSPPADHILLPCDEQQMKQLVWNLCLNAIQAMPGGGALNITLTIVDTRNTAPAPIQLMVEDEGCGIPEDKFDLIFDPFFTTKDDGIGLGLARVRQIVENHGGKIVVGNRTPRGTRFLITFPGPDPKQYPLRSAEKY